MSSSYIIEPQESGSGKKDDTLIIIVNDDGTISVDQETLQTLISKLHYLDNLGCQLYILNIHIDFQ